MTCRIILVPLPRGTSDSTHTIDLFDIGVDVACPVAEKYKRLFLTPKGDYNNIVTAYMAACALDPLVAATTSDEELADTHGDLTMFEFNKFKPVTMQDLIDEIQKYRAAINSTSDCF